MNIILNNKTRKLKFFELNFELVHADSEPSHRCPCHYATDLPPDSAELRHSEKMLSFSFVTVFHPHCNSKLK